MLTNCILFVIANLLAAAMVDASGQHDHRREHHHEESDGEFYVNQWAIHVPKGEHAAKEIADEHKFTFHGQVTIKCYLR